MPRFPLMHRYTQLKPFDITPDDVLSTQQQLCVNYIPPTLGAPCNVTMTRRPMIRNEDGFDRNGLDIDGKTGIDQQTELQQHVQEPGRYGKSS